MTGLLLFLGLGFVLAWALVVAITWWTLTRPPRRGYGTAVARGMPGDPSEMDEPATFETVTLASGHGNAWMILGDEPEGCVIVATHGWGRARQDALARFDAVRGICSWFIAWDMPGHGEAGGVSYLGLRERRALERVLEATTGSIDRPVVLWGWSMGAGVSIDSAVHRAERSRLCGVIAEAPYGVPSTPARNVLAASALPHRLTLRPALWLIGLLAGNPAWRGFDRILLAERLTLPLLVLHGSDDAVSPVEDGRAIANAAPSGQLCEIPSGTHNGLWTDNGSRQVSRDAIARFLERITVPGDGTTGGVESLHENAGPAPEPDR